MRQLGLKQPIAVIPNGVSLSGGGGLVHQEREQRPEDGKRKVLLFLGRLHPKKGLAELIEAWAKTEQRKNWTLVIAGWGERGYVDSLKRLAKERGLKGSGEKAEGPLAKSPDGEIFFAGPAFGKQKERLLANADAFVLPSHSEGLPVAVLEAWSHAVPVVMTAECNLPEGFQAGAALEVKLKPTTGGPIPGLAEGLEKLVTMKEEERRKMGLKGLKLVERKFTWPEVAARFLEMYQWLLGQTKDKPEFVRD